ncbi:MAG TPA: response regulator transcription factor [Actinomycetota bacterium]|nr:response regulator transcription factor [Actinomycetota bacterium]
MRILVVEDEDRLRGLIVRALTEEGHVVDAAADGEEGAYLIKEVAFEAVVLDWMLPKLSGVDLCRQMRESDDWTPVIMLTARDALEDRVDGLDAGADDYLVKPFAFTELSARLRALGRRGSTPRPTILKAGSIALDPATHTATVGDELVDLTAKEFALLEHLLRHKGEVLSRASLIENVWDFAYDGGSNVVDVYIGYLRRKIREEGQRIESVRGIGYRLAE